MTFVITRWFFLLLIYMLVTGCSLPALNLSTEKEAELFAQGLDQYLASDDPKTLQQLSQQYPQGKWRIRAETIIDMVKEQRQLQAQLGRQERDLTLCRQDKVNLFQDNQMLEETLNRLKEVLVDTEKLTE